MKKSYLSALIILISSHIAFGRVPNQLDNKLIVSQRTPRAVRPNTTNTLLLQHPHIRYPRTIARYMAENNPNNRTAIYDTFDLWIGFFERTAHMPEARNNLQNLTQRYTEFRNTTLEIAPTERATLDALRTNIENAQYLIEQAHQTNN